MIIIIDITRDCKLRPNEIYKITTYIRIDNIAGILFFFKIVLPTRENTNALNQIVDCYQ